MSARNSDRQRSRRLRLVWNNVFWSILQKRKRTLHGEQVLRKCSKKHALLLLLQ